MAGQINSSADDTTIAAIATPPGPSGIGIIRVSGPSSLPIVKTLFKPHKNKTKLISHKMVYGWLIDPSSLLPVDEVMVVYMQAPNSYTREDVVEIQCHGSFLILQDILGRVLEAGAVLAAPGEFTKRAFLNGRIDLTKAEAVIELLQARTREGLKLAVSQLQGTLFDKISSVREVLLSMRAIIEVAIDFPEDDVEIMDYVAFAASFDEVIKLLAELIAAADHGKIFREGISVVIAGQPNVGKSSLLNSLLKEERAIVTAIPGTTRDTIEEYLDIKGMPVRIVDTAGIREATGEVEQIGIQRAREKQEEADLVLLMVDASKPLADIDHSVHLSVADKDLLLVLNKIDLAPDLDLTEYEKIFPDIPMVAISAKTHEGLNRLEEAIFNLVAGSSINWDPGHACVPNVRHKAALLRALSSASVVVEALRDRLPPDLVAIDLQAVLDYLGDIIGVTTAEDVLDMIFERFCLGK
ncbi:MAG: tRNA uridine-5-carboxymethylaminomethyl(34) synthesis GTPase MnmE [Proteobacteria bacterium]|nr:tRNA uridine-5-carboxymethylaminomethyl(34) synthesis GTPase MnmE [Pseudomonadota bacterium]MBU1714189.1 tRNA uridine-5-carboxymethylaminomethyl(34) synthesis GTPase MnmE [Pseudomonadota bacterium]